MLDVTLKAQLKTYLERITLPVELVASLDDSPAATPMRALLEDIAALHPLVSARFDGDDADHVRRPSFAIRRVGSDIDLRFAAVPLGHEFTSLVLALLQPAATHPRWRPSWRRRFAPWTPGRAARCASRPGCR